MLHILIKKIFGSKKKDSDPKEDPTKANTPGIAKKVIAEPVIISICPNCSYQFDKQVKRKKKCPACSKFIFVRNGQLMKEIECIEYDLIARAAADLNAYGVTRESILKRQQILSEKHNVSYSIKDTIWGIYSEVNQDLMVKGAYDELSILYWCMAMYKIAIDKTEDANTLLKESHKLKLKQMHKHGVSKVIIGTAGEGNSCESCLKLNNKKLTIEKALKEMPLPHKKCNNKIGYCRCLYMAD